MSAYNKLNNPTFIYGTAWKEGATADLVQTAFKAGFKAIDTANQPKHYNEPFVGEALSNLINQGTARNQIFLQTKFTLPGGQDHRIPYDINADLRVQTHQSFESSLKNLRSDYLDSYLLHGPHTYGSLIEEDWEIWRSLEEIYRSGKIKMIGVSNVNEEQLKLLVEKAKIKPMIVQNRCFANQGWDRNIRKICRANKIIYQGFSLLTANPFVLQNQKLVEIAKSLQRTPIQVIFRFSTQIGILPLTGMTQIKHMKEDLQIFNFEISQDDLETIETLYAHHA